MQSPSEESVEEPSEVVSVRFTLTGEDALRIQNEASHRWKPIRPSELAKEVVIDQLDFWYERDR